MSSNLASYFQQGQQGQGSSNNSRNDRAKMPYSANDEDLGPSVSMAVMANDDSDFKKNTFNLKRTRSMGVLDDFLITKNLSSPSSSSSDAMDSNDTSTASSGLQSKAQSNSNIPYQTNQGVSAVELEKKLVETINTTNKGRQIGAPSSSGLSSSRYRYNSRSLSNSNFHSSPNSGSNSTGTNTPDRNYSTPPMADPNSYLTPHDDCDAIPEVSGHVDYFSHKWDESDISKSWKYIVFNKKKSNLNNLKKNSNNSSSGNSNTTDNIDDYRGIGMNSNTTPFNNNSTNNDNGYWNEFSSNNDNNNKNNNNSSNDNSDDNSSSNDNSDDNGNDNGSDMITDDGNRNGGYFQNDNNQQYTGGQVFENVNNGKTNGMNQNIVSSHEVENEEAEEDYDAMMARVNASRLENASWRTWAKARNNLKTVSPAVVNWSKESDDTWLYGPIVPGTRNMDEYDTINDGSQEQITSLSNSATPLPTTLSDYQVNNTEINGDNHNNDTNKGGLGGRFSSSTGSNSYFDSQVSSNGDSPTLKPILKKRTVTEIIEENAQWRLDQVRQQYLKNNKHRNRGYGGKSYNRNTNCTTPTSASMHKNSAMQFDHEDYNALAAQVNAQYRSKTNSSNSLSASMNSAQPLANQGNGSDGNTLIQATAIQKPALDLKLNNILLAQSASSTHSSISHTPPPQSPKELMHILTTGRPLSQQERETSETSYFPNVSSAARPGLVPRHTSNDFKIQAPVPGSSPVLHIPTPVERHIHFNDRVEQREVVPHEDYYSHSYNSRRSRRIRNRKNQHFFNSSDDEDSDEYDYDSETDEDEAGDYYYDPNLADQNEEDMAQPGSKKEYKHAYTSYPRHANVQVEDDSDEDKGDDDDNEGNPEENGGLFISSVRNTPRPSLANSQHFSFSSSGSFKGKNGFDNGSMTYSKSLKTGELRPIPSSIRLLPATSLNYGSDDELNFFKKRGDQSSYMDVDSEGHYGGDEYSMQHYGHQATRPMNTSRSESKEYTNYDYNSVYTGDTSSYILNSNANCDIVDVPQQFQSPSLYSKDSANTNESLINSSTVATSASDNTGHSKSYATSTISNNQSLMSVNDNDSDDEPQFIENGGSDDDSDSDDGFIINKKNPVVSATSNIQKADSPNMGYRGGSDTENSVVGDDDDCNGSDDSGDGFVIKRTSSGRIPSSTGLSNAGLSAMRAHNTSFITGKPLIDTPSLHQNSSFLDSSPARPNFLSGSQASLSSLNHQDLQRPSSRSSHRHVLVAPKKNSFALYADDHADSDSEDDQNGNTQQSSASIQNAFFINGSHHLPQTSKPSISEDPVHVSYSASGKKPTNKVFFQDDSSSDSE